MVPLEVSDIFRFTSLTEHIGEIADKYTTVYEVLLFHCF